MSDLMLTAVLSMPYDMAMADDLSRRQFYDRAQQALEVIERLTAERDDLRRLLSEWLRENSPGGWIDELRRQLADAIRERDELRRQLAEAEQRADDDACGAAEEIDMRASDE